jgi:hypothetical protein
MKNIYLKIEIKHRMKNIEIKMAEEFIQNDYCFFCGVCHRIFCYESSISYWLHFDKYQLHPCKITASEEEIKECADSMMELNETSKLSFTKINSSKEAGVVIYVYDLGNFLFEHSEKIKNKPVSVLQIPYKPMAEQISKMTFLSSLDDIDFDVLLPSEFCQTTYPCQHMVYLHLRGEDWNQWHEYKKMSGDQIHKYTNYLPKHSKSHFCNYK